MKPIELNVLWQTAEEATVERLGLENDDKVDTKERKVVLFTAIDCFFATEKYGREFTCVVSGGSEYLADIRYAELKSLLTEQWNKQNYRPL